MKQQEVFKKIGGIIKELNDQFEYLQTVEGQLNELELELFLANSHFLGDHVLILSKLNSQNSVAKKPEAHYEQNFFVPLVQTPAPKAAEKPFEQPSDYKQKPTPHLDIEASNEDAYSFTHEDEPETIRHELILDEADWDEEDEPYQPNTIHDALKQEIVEEAPVVTLPVVEIAEPIVPEPVVHDTVTPEPAAPEPVVFREEPKPIEEKPASPLKKEEVLTINERMSAKLAAMAGVGVQAKEQPITDLKQAITLNDKLLFIKELFNGYSLAYSEAIEILNRFNSFNEADLFLKKNYVVKNAWESKPETTGKFYDLLKRRYE